MDKLSKTAIKMCFYEANNLNTDEAENEFLDCLTEYADSGELNLDDYSEQMDHYRKMIESEIPLGALRQHLNAANTIINKIDDLFREEGLSENVIWHIDLFFVCSSNINGLRSVFQYDFDSVQYPEGHEDAFCGIDIDYTSDRNGFTEKWIDTAKRIIVNVFKALDDGDIVLQNMYLSDLYNIGLMSAFICD